VRLGFRKKKFVIVVKRGATVLRAETIHAHSEADAIFELKSRVRDLSPLDQSISVIIEGRKVVG
jgi:hypothetical protein